MKKFLIVLTIFLTASVALASNLTINSDTQSFTNNENKAHFDGNVKVMIDNIVIKSPHAEANVDPKSKKLTNAIFKDKAYAVQYDINKKNEVKANIIKMSLLDKIITAEGNTQSI